MVFMARREIAPNKKPILNSLLFYLKASVTQVFPFFDVKSFHSKLGESVADKTKPVQVINRVLTVCPI